MRGITKEWVVDVTNLPAEIKEFTYNYFKNHGYSNGTFKNWYIGDHDDDDEKNLLEQYLLSNGLKEGDKVIIKLWW